MSALRVSAAALGCLLAAAIIVVAVPVPHAAEPVTISYSGDLAALARQAPYPAVAPAGLPASWQPVSSGLAVGRANGAGTVTWQLGFMTPDGALAALAETNANAAAYVRRMTNDGTPLAPTRLDGQTWRTSSTPVNRSMPTKHSTPLTSWLRVRLEHSTPRLVKQLPTHRRTTAKESIGR